MRDRARKRLAQARGFDVRRERLGVRNARHNGGVAGKKWLAAVRAETEGFDTIQLGGRAKQKRRPKAPPDRPRGAGLFQRLEAAVDVIVQAEANGVVIVILYRIGSAEALIRRARADVVRSEVQILILGLQRPIRG